MTRKPDRRLLITFPAVVFLAGALVLLLRPSATTYLDLLRQGDEHAARAERTGAVAAYREAVRLRPGDPLPYLRLAQVYLDWGRTDEALEAVAETGRLGAEEADGPTTLTASLERLQVAIYAARADWPAVVEHAQRLLALAPADGSTARLSSPKSELAGVLDDAETIRHILARATVEMREWDAARAEYGKLLDVDPTDPVAHERLGALLLGDDPAAIQHLFAARTDLAGGLIAALQEAGAVDDPAYSSVLLGRVLFEAQEWALSVRQFECALSHNPDYPDAHAYLGHALDQMGHPDEAQPHLQRAVALAPDSAVAHTFLGLHYDRLGDFSTARAEYETAYDLDPDNPATCVEIGQTWAAEERYVAAEIWLLEAVSLQPDDPALWEVLARFYLDHNIAAAGQGVEATSKLLELSPDDARAHDLRGWAAFQVGDYGAAQGSLLRAVSLDPALAVAHYHLGLLWSGQGAHEKARESFVRALDLNTTGELVPLVERVLGELP